jgi:signal transduction histidine kinase/tetratricopeptide (TPR) repeat protein
MHLKFILFLLMCSLTVNAQKEGQAWVDSLLNAMPTALNDTVKAKILNRVALYYASANTDTGLKYTAMGMNLAGKMKWLKGISAFNTCYGNIYVTKGKLDSALYFHLKALECSKKINDSINMGVAYNNLGTVAEAKSDFVSAAKYYIQTLQLGKALKNNYNIAVACENIALVYQEQQDYSRGIEYARQSIAAYELDNDREELAGPLELIGTFFLHLNKYDSAYSYYQKALSNARTNGNKLKEGAALNSLAEYFAKQKDYFNAIKYGLEGKTLWDSTVPAFEDAINNGGLLGNYYLQLAKQADTGKINSSLQIPATKEKLLKLATAYLTEAIQKCKAKGNQNSQSTFQNYLAEANALEGNYKDAYFNFKSYQQIKDSIFSQENKNKIAAVENQRAIDLKNKEIENKELQIGNQRKRMWLLASCIAFLITVGGLVYRQSLTRKKTNTTLLQLNTELDEANKVKAKFFGILSHDLRSPVANLINFLQLQKRKPGIMNEQQIAERENKISDSANALLDTMEAMLLWSKGQMEHFKPSVAEVAVNDLFIYLEHFFTGTEHVSFSFENQENLILQTDEDYLKTIMHNLTANAVKALQQTTGAKITWKAWKQQTNIYLSIIDNGTGVSKEQLKALYDETATSGSRHGLGLHIIRDLAKAIGCSITLQPQTKTGTEFILCI